MQLDSLSAHIIMDINGIFLVFLNLIDLGRAARILGIFATPSRSHYTLGHRLMERLAERGHQVTYVSPFAQKVVNYNQLVLTGFYEKLHRDSINFFVELEPTTIQQTLYLSDWGKNLTIDVFEHPNMKQLLSSNNRFDVVIVEQFFMEALKGLAWYYKAHLVLFDTITSTTWLNSLVGNPSPPSFIPEPLSGYPTNMSFFERLGNFVDRLSVEIILHFFDYPTQNRLLHEYFPDAPHINDIIYNTSLVLVNSDISVGQAIPKVPCMIDVGGIHIKPENGIPNDLQTWLNEATEGVVYFSMGSNLRSALLPDYTKEWLLKVFAKLKYKVLWKFEENLPNKPPNVEIRQWLPQQDILGHPNVKLFITHGGLLSTIESVYFGLPMLAIPVFGDQRMNSVQTKRNGLGLYIHYDNLTEEYFKNCLEELLTKERYAAKAREASRIMHDKPMKPMDSAIYWIEYIIRHHGATHLRVEAIQLSFIQYLSLDVIFFLAILPICSILIIQYMSHKYFMQSGLSNYRN